MDLKQFFDYKLKNIMDQVQFAEYVTDSVTSEMICKNCHIYSNF